MLKNPYAIILYLISIESLVLYIASRRRFAKYFHFIPPVFWIYFLPMLSSTAGILDSQSPVYQTITSLLLPASLVLLLLSSDIKAIMRLGRPALIMMFAGSLGIMIAVPLVFGFMKQFVGNGMWSGFGALSASWIGGSANMVAVKEALGTPDAVFAPMVIVDTVVPYVWMGFLIAAAGWQAAFDAWNKSDTRITNDLHQSTNRVQNVFKKGLSLKAVGAILSVAVLGTIIPNFLGGTMPIVKNVFSTYAWTIIAASILGIAFSFTRLRKLESSGSTKVGYVVLYFVLTAIGAKANISNINATAVLIVCGFLIVLIHGIGMLVAARIIRAPMFLVATASQANIGGVASAPVVAAVYQPGLASVGLLLAILGNIMGTYLGIITGQLCRIAGQ
ncbi:MAG TPA: DUF819 family protein [Candidatus Omnitrophota bacterium]|nr:DUF819 family protein [Candidatus Omnitrophota bacterium]HPT06618.1 DUF819 family protein [Candidatus Omnitrophota bacterium]